MKSVPQPESLAAEMLDDAELDAARGGLRPADLIDILRPVRPSLPLPRLPILRPLPRLPLPPPPPDPVRLLRPVLS